jgi:ribosomal protein L40E
MYWTVFTKFLFLSLLLHALVIPAVLVMFYFAYAYPVVAGIRCAKMKSISPHWMWFGIHPVTGWIAYLIITSRKSDTKICYRCAARLYIGAEQCPGCGLRINPVSEHYHLLLRGVRRCAIVLSAPRYRWVTIAVISLYVLLWIAIALFDGHEPTRWKIANIVTPSRSLNDVEELDRYLKDFPEGPHAREAVSIRIAILEERRRFESRIGEFIQLALHPKGDEEARPGEFHPPFYFANADSTTFRFSTGDMEQTRTFADARTLVVCDVRDYFAGYYAHEGNVRTDLAGYGKRVSMDFLNLDEPSKFRSEVRYASPPETIYVRPGNAGGEGATKSDQQLVWELLGDFSAGKEVPHPPRKIERKK